MQHVLWFSIWIKKIELEGQRGLAARFRHIRSDQSELQTLIKFTTVYNGLYEPNKRYIVEKR